MKSLDEAFAALEEGKGRTRSPSGQALCSWIAVNAKDSKALILLPEDLSFEPYAIGLPRGDAGAAARGERRARRIYRDGEIVSIFKQVFREVRRAHAPDARHVHLRHAAGSELGGLPPLVDDGLGAAAAGAHHARSPSSPFFTTSSV